MLGVEFKMSEWFIPALYVLLAIFLIWRAKGLHNILRFLVRFFKINYTDKKLKRLDDTWFNIQLFKFTTGINVSTIESARNIQSKLNSGEINPSIFIFANSWGDITKGMPWWRAVIQYIIAFILISISVFLYKQQLPLVYHYAKSEYLDMAYYISNDKVIMNTSEIPPDLHEGRSKKDCSEALSSKLIPKGSLFEHACNRLLDESDLSKNRLQGEIEKTELIKRNLTILYCIYFFLGVFIFVTLTRFIIASRTVRKIINNP